MSQRSKRLGRVLRIMRLEHRKALLEQASAARALASIQVTGEKLANSQARTVPDSGIHYGSDLACRGEWIDRLARSAHALRPAILQAERLQQEAVQTERRAAIKAERVQERVSTARHEEERIRDSLTQLARRNPRLANPQ
ncbi:MAG: hypothetical protein ACK4SJ_07795 [Sphingorhabdus sp.]